MGDTCGQCVYFMPAIEDNEDGERDEGRCVIDGDPGVSGLFDDDSACSGYLEGEEE